MKNFLTASEVEAFLNGNGGQYLSEEDRAAFSTGRLRLIETSVKVRKKISSASGILNLIDSNTGKLVGLSDFDKQKLENPFVITAVATAGNITATSGSPVAQALVYARTASAFDKVYASAKLTVRQDSQIKVRKNVAELICDGAALVPQANTAVPLSMPQVLNTKGNIEISVEFPASQTVTADSTNSTFIEVELLGYELVAKQ